MKVPDKMPCTSGKDIELNTKQTNPKKDFKEIVQNKISKVIESNPGIFYQFGRTLIFNLCNEIKTNNGNSDNLSINFDVIRSGLKGDDKDNICDITPKKRKQKPTVREVLIRLKDSKNEILDVEKVIQNKNYEGRLDLTEAFSSVSTFFSSTINSGIDSTQEGIKVVIKALLKMIDEIEKVELENDSLRINSTVAGEVSINETSKNKFGTNVAKENTMFRRLSSFLKRIASKGRTD